MPLPGVSTKCLPALLVVLMAGWSYAQTDGIVSFVEESVSRHGNVPEIPDDFSFSEPVVPTQRFDLTDLPQVPQDLSFSSDPTAGFQANWQANLPDYVRQPASMAIYPRPWWSADRRGNHAEMLKVELDELIWLAVAHSPLVKSLLIEPQIFEERARQRLGDFDPSRFVDSIFRDTSDPVGNTLITGGPPRLNENLWENRAGFRSLNQRGGQTEFFQEFLFQDNNSLFFEPSNQADTRMVLRYTQPLMRGRGLEYNRASFVVASIAADQSKYQASWALQQHVFRVVNAYWELYSAEATQQQILAGISRLSELVNRLQGRTEIDSVQSQILRAEAAVARQRGNLAQAQAQQLAAQASIKSLVASPSLLNNRLPMIPVTPIVDEPPQNDIDILLRLALQTQPRILEARQTIRSARTRLRVAEHELKPTLNLVMEGYLRGLNGDFDAPQSFVDQFTGRPGYAAGLAYQRPRRNIAAQAIARERRMELQRALLELDDTLLNVGAEVESAVAAVYASYQLLESAIRATLANHAELDYLQAIWNDSFVRGPGMTSLQLDQLLNAHIQLISSENQWAAAERDFMISLARLDLSTGSLLPAEEPTVAP